jgi:hypothetical protein
MFVAQRLAVLPQSPLAPAEGCYALRFTHWAYYLAGQPRQDLLALVQIQQSSSGNPAVAISIFPSSESRIHELEALPSTPDALAHYAHQQNLPWVHISSPLLLEPVTVPKPWGQEIWYTGIEARGQAAVIGQGGSLPLPWVMEFLREQLDLAELEQLILLKVLDPLPDEGYGDLYFELHERKQEVYVVTHVDKSAWPDGCGAIQLGFSPDAQKEYKTEAALKAAYGAAVKRYETVRRAIDALLDEKKQQQGMALSQPVAAHQLKLWINELTQVAEYQHLIELEKEYKQAMNSFIALQPLAVGDVVTVPRLVPHALQHGVRVVEFQTPVYERKILSFGQKVLTQEHWDTVEALTLVDMAADTLIKPESLLESAAVQVQRIVNFDEFEVRRIRLCGQHELKFDRYCLLMLLEGDASLTWMESSLELGAGEVALVPAKSQASVHLKAATPCLLLQAIPARSTAN